MLLYESTCSRASSFFPPTTTLFSDVWSCISQDFLSPPMAAGLPSFGCIGPRLLSMLRLSISSASPCSAGPCGPGPTAAPARNFNTEISPATFLGQLRSCRLVGQSEFQSGGDFRPSSHFAILISRFSSLDSELSGASAGDSDPAVCGIHLHDSD